ncbi:C4-dicarboxylate ABC transporter [Bacillus pseudomycoides]|nr:C4-dicarboxylate ABC transporter [Bacillus pseudomycoides]
MASTLSAMHVIPLDGLALLLGGNRFLSETRAIVNLIANGIATVVVAKRENEFNEGKGKQMLIRMQKEKIAG